MELRKGSVVKEKWKKRTSESVIEKGNCET